MTNSDRRVVVGYDGSPASRAALDCAAGRAAPHGVVVAVHCYDAPATFNPSRHTGEYQRAVEVAEDRGRALLDAPPASYNGVAVEKELVSGPAPRVLANIAS